MLWFKTIIFYFYDRTLGDVKLTAQKIARYLYRANTISMDSSICDSDGLTIEGILKDEAYSEELFMNLTIIKINPKRI